MALEPSRANGNTGCKDSCEDSYRDSATGATGSLYMRLLLGSFVALVLRSLYPFRRSGAFQSLQLAALPTDGSFTFFFFN